MPSQTSDIDHSRLARVTVLLKGSHIKNDEPALCAMEAVAYIAREPWSDHPECACPVLTAFMQAWNDGIDDNAERTALLLPVIPRLVGTRGSKALERRRACMAADWLIRTHAVAWLRLAKLDKQADLLASLPEITDFAQCPSLLPTLEAVRTDADAAWDAAGAAAWAAARAAAWDAAGAAAGAAAWDAAGGAARAAARAAAWAAARAAAGAALNKTRLELQQSALALLNRMIEATEP